MVLLENMAIYNYPSYCTVFSAKVNSIPIARGRRACYMDSLRRCIRNNNTAEYKIYLYTDDRQIELGCNNRCFMQKHQLENYLRRIKSIKPFSYKVVETVLNGYPVYCIELKINGTKKEITFVLQCIKRTYEWPYNFFLMHAYKMQQLNEYKRDSILNLFNVIYSTYKDSKNTDHCFSGKTYFEKYSTLREKLPHIDYVVDLYPDYCNRVIKANRIKNIQYWNNIPCNTAQFDEVFDKVFPVYVENYQILKR